jgi:alpha-glucosidase
MPPGARDAGAPPWWRAGVLYQIYPRSFADTTGDGHGDLAGVIAHLDHLEWLGVDGIWLSPINTSPQADWGYDVADYRAIDPDFGTLDDLDRLVDEAGRRGIRVLMDLVPNHTSDRHPWFLDARSSREAAHRDWYVWADGKGDGPPNNWRSPFGGSAWEWDDATGQYYLHNFLPQQPDLNWWNPEVREAFDGIVRFWFDRGVAGFRIDVAHALVKDELLRDDSAALETDHPSVRAQGLRSDFSMNRPETHDVFRHWRALANAYEPPRVLLGETYVWDLEAMARFYGSGSDELDLALNVPFMHATPGPAMREVVERTQALLPLEGWPLWAGSNHDAGRFPTRWADDDERIVRASLVLLFTLRGTPLLYYGDEIGMRELPIPRDRLRDPVGLREDAPHGGRDGCRTPMQWTADGGFTRDGVEPWLPIGDLAARNVADQRGNRASLLHLCRDLITLRRGRPELTTGPVATVEAADGIWAWRRGDRIVVAINQADAAGTLEVGEGRILIGTDRGRDGERVEEACSLDPWEAVVLETAG